MSASATVAPGSTRNYKGERGVAYTAARELSADEIRFFFLFFFETAIESFFRTRLVEDFRLAARNAKHAGFDFVEIHSAHGYRMGSKKFSFLIF